MSPPYQVCARCVMDTTDADIAFDAEGICNHCRAYEREILPKRPPPDVMARQFTEMIAEVKHAGRNKAYDCVLVISEHALREAALHPGPTVVDVRVPIEETVYPMVPAGADLHKMIRRPSPIAETAAD